MSEPAPHVASDAGARAPTDEPPDDAFSEEAPAAERRVVLLLAAVQFVNILDFMMPSPLGPRFAADLAIETSSLGIVVASYTLSAGVAGLLGAFFLDRYDRRPALALSLLGLAVGTGGAAFAWDLPTLVLARVVAGAFGGPATALALAIVADVVPVSRRGRALGAVMMAFSVASVLGVPMGLVLADWGSWHTPFLVTAVLCALAAAGARLHLPSLRAHVALRAQVAQTPPLHPWREVTDSIRALVAEPAVRLSYGMGLASAFGAFMLIPNIATFVQNNFGYPASLLSLLYGAGGLASLIVLRPLGRLVDRVGSFPVSLFGAVGYAGVCALCFIFLPPWIEDLCRTRHALLGVSFSWGWFVVALLFVLFMLTSNARNVAFGTLNSRVPPPALRARYQSLSSMVQHVGLAAGGLTGPLLLRSEPDGSLVGIDRIAWLSIAVLLAIPWLLRGVERRIDARDGVRRGATAPQRGDA
jgi:predicted MFS family arabinose efflux permease